jgi:thiamine-monophosphate kinase
VEGVHFRADTAPALIGRKALARCLSDIAAMAGTPAHALITLGLESGYDAARVEAVYSGLTELARRHGVGVVGGETTTVPQGMWLNIALLGWVEPGRCPRRSGAQPGDAVFVTGTLGGSLVSGHHLTFEPRLAEARWLAGQCEVHAMIDLSDGLAGDLGHVLRASGVGAELRAAAIPLSRAAREAAARGGRSALEAAMGDGEDFELLFTVPARDAVPLLDAWRTRFESVRLSCIGKITPERGLRIRDRHGLRPLEAHGYTHFQVS